MAKIEPGLFKRPEVCTHGKAKWSTCSCDWWVRYRPSTGGKRIRANFTEWWVKHHPETMTATLANYEAVKRAFAYFKNLADGQHETLQDAESLRTLKEKTFTQVIDEYVEWKMLNKPFRSETFQWQLATLQEKLGAYPIVKLSRDPKIVEAVILRMAKDREWKPRTRNRWKAIGTMVFKWAAPRYRDLGLTNPFELITTMAGESVSREVRLPEDIEKKLIKGISLIEDPTDRLLMEGRFYNAFDTGMRIRETMMVKFKHLNMDTWEWLLPPHISKAGAKRGVDETAFVTTDRLRKWLKARFMALGRDMDAHPFGTINGKFQRSFDKLAIKVFENAGVPWGMKTDKDTGKPLGFRWHDLRHEFAFRIAKLAGGNTIAIKHYTRLNSDTMISRYVARDKELVDLKVATK